MPGPGQAGTSCLRRQAVQDAADGPLTDVQAQRDPRDRCAGSRPQGRRNRVSAAIRRPPGQTRPAVKTVRTWSRRPGLSTRIRHS